MSTRHGTQVLPAEQGVEAGLTRQTVYRIKGDPAGAEAAPSPPPVGIVIAPEPYVLPGGVGRPAGLLRADRQAVDMDEVLRKVRVGQEKSVSGALLEHERLIIERQIVVLQQNDLVKFEHSSIEFGISCREILLYWRIPHPRGRLVVATEILRFLHECMCRPSVKAGTLSSKTPE